MYATAFRTENGQSVIVRDANHKIVKHTTEEAAKGFGEALLPAGTEVWGFNIEGACW
jgi:hypothetical protein